MQSKNDMRTCDVCPTCRRPFRQLKNTERARSGHQEGLEHKAAKSLTNAGEKCKRVYDFLRWEKHVSLTRSHRVSYTDNDGWVCGEDLREWLGTGDWQRRVRQLSEEFGVPIERKMDNPNGGRKIAYYKLGEENELYV